MIFVFLCLTDFTYCEIFKAFGVGCQTVLWKGRAGLPIALSSVGICPWACSPHCPGFQGTGCQTLGSGPCLDSFVVQGLGLRVGRDLEAAGASLQQG